MDVLAFEGVFVRDFVLFEPYDYFYLGSNLVSANNYLDLSFFYRSWLRSLQLLIYYLVGDVIGRFFFSFTVLSSLIYDG